MSAHPDHLSAIWRQAAVDRWYDAQDHVGEADTNPDPFARAAGDAAVRVVLAYLQGVCRVAVTPERIAEEIDSLVVDEHPVEEHR